MTRRLAFIFAIATTVLSLNAQNLQLYPFKSGMIKYKFEGKTTFYETIYFDDYGRLYSNLKTTTIISNSIIKHDSILTILKNDTIYELNINKNSLIISPKNVITDNGKQYLISNDMIQALGFTKLGNEDVAGISCDKYESENGSLWIWNNIVLKSEIVSLDTNIITEAT